MADDRNWFTRQASRTAEDIKQLPEWLRTQREENEEKGKQDGTVQGDPNKEKEKLSA